MLETIMKRLDWRETERVRKVLKEQNPLLRFIEYDQGSVSFESEPLKGEFQDAILAVVCGGRSRSKFGLSVRYNDFVDEGDSQAIILPDSQVLELRTVLPF